MGHKKEKIPPKSTRNAGYKAEVKRLEAAAKKLKKTGGLNKEQKKELDKQLAKDIYELE